MKRHLRHLVVSGMIALGIALAGGPSSLGQSSVVAVPPPQVSDYWVSISRQPGGVLVFDGYTPSAASRDALGLHAGADVSWLKLGSGGPSGYDAATAFGLDVLDRLSEGRFALRGSVLSVGGIAATQADFITLYQTLAEQVPEGLILAKAEISAPRIEPYAFSLRRQPNGNVLLSGFVPNPDIENRLLLAIGARASSTLRFGSGEPVNFEANLDKVLPLFALLQEGEVKLDSGTWLFSGTPLTSADGESIRATFDRDHLSEAGWGLTLTVPAAPRAPVETQTAAAASEPEPAVTETVPVAEAAQPQPEPAPVAEAAPQVQPHAAPAASTDTIEQCRTNLAALSAQNGILFRSGAAVLADGTQTILAAIAEAIKHCPGVAVDIVGHTDSDGEAAANLALSVARAEAVVAALIGLGVEPERLYAIGYGESQPVADNATAAGKAQNRRIVVSVHDGA